MAWTPPASDKAWTPPSSDKPADAGDYDVPGTSPESRAMDGPPDRVGQAEAFGQGAILDPIEKLGAMGSHLPGWMQTGIEMIPGVGQAERIGRTLSDPKNMPDWMKKTLETGKKAGEAHPGYRTAGNIAPFLALPAPAGIMGAIGQGAVGGALQPTDPNDPHFWRDTGLQAGGGGLLGGIFGTIGKGISTWLQRAAKATADHAKDANAAIAANVRSAGETNLANKAAQSAHAQALTDRAQASAKAMVDHHEATANWASAAADHLSNMASWTQREAQKAQQYLSDFGENILRRAQLEAQHATNMQAHEADMARRANLDKEQTLGWLQRALGKVGLADKAPTEVGEEAFATTRSLIGGKLNEANEQLKLNPGAADLIERLRGIGRTLTRGEGESILQGISDKQRFGELMRNRVLSPIADAIRDDEGNVVGWKAKSELSGQQFANYVTMLNQEADSLARSARYPGRDTTNQLKMAQALHDMVDIIEDGAEGSAAAKTLRDNAREAYRSFSTLSRAADPKNGSIVKSGPLVDEVERRAGGPMQHQSLFLNPTAKGYEDAVAARNWRRQAITGAPPEPKLELPPAPTKPTAEKPPVEPAQAKAPPKAPAELPMPKAPKLQEPTRVPVPERPPTVGRALGQAGKLVGHALAHKVAPGIAGRILAPTLGEVASRAAGTGAVGRGARAVGRGLRGVVQAPGRRPGVTGKLPDIVIQSITPGRATDNASQQDDF